MSFSFADVRPFVRYAQIITITDFVRLRNIAAYDFRLFYVRSGQGSIIVDGVSYTARRGTMLIFRPGVEYSLLNLEGGFMELIALSFDLDFLNNSVKSPIPPSKIAEFAPCDIVFSGELCEDVPFYFTVYIPDAERHEPILFKIWEEYKNKFRSYEHKISGLALAVLSDAFDCSESGAVSPRGNGTVEEIISIIKESYGRDITNEQIGRALGYHPNHLNRLMIRYTGVSLHRYLLNYRIERALDELEMTDRPISEIATMVGFDDFSYFSKQFKKKTGYSPSEYRRAHKSV